MLIKQRYSARCLEEEFCEVEFLGLLLRRGVFLFCLSASLVLWKRRSTHGTRIAVLYVYAPGAALDKELVALRGHAAHVGGFQCLGAGGLGFGLETHYVLKSDLAGGRRPDVGETPYV
jgi:hypothetical protein